MREDYPILAEVEDIPVLEVEDIVQEHWVDWGDEETLRGRLAEKLRWGDAYGFDAFAAALSVSAVSADHALDLERLEGAFVELDRGLTDDEIARLLAQPVREISLQLQQRMS